jgi:hypothetical protein
MEELFKLLGFTTPLIYATAAYRLFHWLDDNASDEAKAALARTMTFKNYKNEQIASALVEVFDWIYTSPLLRWRAFFRSLVYTTVVSIIWLYEAAPYAFEIAGNAVAAVVWGGHQTDVAIFVEFVVVLVFNYVTDYLALFVIRPLLIRSGAKPVTGLALGTVSGIAIVVVGSELRGLADVCTIPQPPPFSECRVSLDLLMISVDPAYFTTKAALPGLLVFSWLPLFALGILIIRLLTPLSWIVGRTQWFLKEGKEHPLKVIGYVAAVVVFLGTVAGRAVFGA